MLWQNYGSHGNTVLGPVNDCILFGYVKEDAIFHASFTCMLCRQLTRTPHTRMGVKAEKSAPSPTGLPNENLVAPWCEWHKKYKKLLLGWNCYKTSCFTRVASTGNIIRVADFRKPNPNPPSKRPPPNNESAKGSLYGGWGWGGGCGMVSE